MAFRSTLEVSNSSAFSVAIMVVVPGSEGMIQAGTDL
jgi:hypothetical protein